VERYEGVTHIFLREGRAIIEDNIQWSAVRLKRREELDGGVLYEGIKV